MQKRERRGLAVVGLAVISVALLGMGAAGKQEVRSSTRAVFVDRDGVRVEAEQVTASGTTEIAGDLGRGSLSFYGQTPVGAYQIRARDLKAVEFAR